MSQSANPVCSVCIANYNGVGVIHECIESVMNQQADFDVEIIVHDDASSDDSVKYIRNHYPNVTLIVSSENVGFCVSNNRMAAKANGKYLLLLNNDAVLFPDALQTLYDCAENEEKDAVLGIPQYNAATGRLIDCGILFDPFLNSAPNQDFKRASVGMILGACLWLPKKVWNEIGGFPDWFHTLHEDMYICLMARLYGYDVKAIPKSGYLHWVGRSLGGGKIVKNRISTTSARRALSERNRLYVMAMCYPAPLIYVVFPLHMTLLLAEGVLLSIVKKDFSLLKSIYLSAFRSFWENRKILFRNRRSIRKKTIITADSFFSVISVVPHKLRILMKHGLPEIT